MDIWIFRRTLNWLATCHQRFVYPFFFHRFGFGSRILNALKIKGSRRISIGRGVYINAFGWLEVLESPDSLGKISIGDGTYIGNLSHIVSLVDVDIGDRVLIADRVYIGDYVHGFSDIDTPIISQRLEAKRPVRIGAGAWIGENAVVLGASVGVNSVIGANSVVLEDIPDFSVAVGSPARVVRKLR